MMLQGHGLSLSGVCLAMFLFSSLDRTMYSCFLTKLYLPFLIPTKQGKCLETFFFLLNFKV